MMTNLQLAEFNARLAANNADDWFEKATNLLENTLADVRRYQQQTADTDSLSEKADYLDWAQGNIESIEANCSAPARNALKDLHRADAITRFLTSEQTT